MREIDAAWSWPHATKAPLRIIGAGALLLQTDYDRGTKDSDVLESDALDAQTQSRLLALAKQGSVIHQRRRMFIEFVPRGLPFLPQAPRWREPTGLNDSLRHFHVEALDVVDVVVSKLGRFHGEDRSDIEAMVDRGLVAHVDLLSRFRSALEAHFGDDALVVRVQRFNQVERDIFAVDETKFELPDWLTDRFG